MRKIILSMMVSVDGFIEGPDHDINWHVWNDEMDAYMMEFFNKVDTFIYGRKSYELMIDYWPSTEGQFANIMNETPKIVFSKTLDKLEWNSELKKEIDPDEILNIKQQPGKDMVIFAGADIASQFIKHQLIDEYRLIVNPVVLGNGTPFFKNLKAPAHLKLTSTQTFKCGNILICYEPH